MRPAFIKETSSEFERLDFSCFFVSGLRSGKYRFSFRKVQISFSKVQILVSQSRDFHFAKYRFSCCKIQIFILQSTDFISESTNFILQSTDFILFHFTEYNKSTTFTSLDSTDKVEDPPSDVTVCGLGWHA